MKDISAMSESAGSQSDDSDESEEVQEVSAPHKVPCGSASSSGTMATSIGLQLSESEDHSGDGEQGSSSPHGLKDHVGQQPRSMSGGGASPLSFASPARSSSSGSLGSNSSSKKKRRPSPAEDDDEFPLAPPEPKKKKGTRLAYVCVVSKFVFLFSDLLIIL
jgi:hypothetical protein